MEWEEGVAMQKHVLDIAYEILSNNGSPMHINHIAMKAATSGMIVDMPLEQFTRKLGSALAADVKKKKPKFAKVPGKKSGSYQRGVYRHIRRRTNPYKENTIAPKVNTLFTGKAGEYLVMSELLFWGFNVSLMTVDEGIDIIASKDNKYFHIQVKSATKDDAGKFKFTIGKKAFDNNSDSNTFYIFVLRDANNSDIIVIPSSSILEKVTLGIIKGETNLSLSVHKNQANKHYLLNNKSDIHIYLHNFSQIK